MSSTRPTAGRSTCRACSDALTPATRLVVVNAPHNPTGMLPRPRRVGGADRGRSTTRGIHLLADEVYRGLEFDEADRLTAGADAFPRGVSLGVMSKSFAMAGLRIGWLATHDRDLLARCAAFKDYTTICSSAPSEILALIALRARDRVLAPLARDRAGRTSSRSTSSSTTGRTGSRGSVRAAGRSGSRG